MKTTELRIGSYVDYFGKRKVIDVINDTRRIVEFDDAQIERDINLIKPIHLTEDWLLRFGFKKRNDKTFTYDRFVLYFVSKYEFWYLNDRRTNVYFTKVEFVHELQNIIFAMNGEELEVKV